MKKVSENYYVSSQISEEDLDGLKNEGFSLVVCNRPNGEEESQIDFEIIQKRCESMGLTFINLPMVPGNIESELILETKKIQITTIYNIRGGFKTTCVEGNINH